MKKICLLFLAVFSVTFLASQAQGVTIGVKAGFNLANMTLKSPTAELPPFKSVEVLAQGIFAAFRLGPVAVQPELLFSQRGTKWVYDYTDYTMTGYLRTSYLEVPVLVKYSFLSGPAKPFVLAGPSFSYLLKAHWQYTYHSVTGDEPDNRSGYDAMTEFKKTELATVFGAGVDYRLAKCVVSLEARYHLGLSNTASAEWAESGDGITSAKHKGFSVLIGIGF